MICHTQKAYTPLHLARSPSFVISKKDPAVGGCPGAAGAVRTQEARRGRRSGRRAPGSEPMTTATSAGRVLRLWLLPPSRGWFDRARLGFACFIYLNNETAIRMTR